MRIETACLGPLATNCYLVDTGSSRLLIDPAEPGDALERFVAGRKIDWIVDTHGHFDHVGGNWSLPGTPVAMHIDDLLYVDHAVPGHPPIDRELKEGDEVAPGLSVLHLPGHSPGSIVLIGEGVLIVGDLLFAGSIGRTDFPGGSMSAMEASLKRLAALPGDYRVLPGHGPETTLEHERQRNPFLQPLF